MVPILAQLRAREKRDQERMEEQRRERELQEEERREQERRQRERIEAQERERIRQIEGHSLDICLLIGKQKKTKALFRFNSSWNFGVENASCPKHGKWFV